MKLSALFLLAAVFQVAARSNAQTVTYSGSNVPLRTILNTVERQTGYVFIADAALIDKARTVTVTANNMQLSGFLQLVLKDQDLDFLIESKTIVISAAKISRDGSDTPVIAVPLPIDVSGRIVDEDGNGIAASIVVKGTITGIASNSDGYFKLQGISGNEILVISGVNIEEMEVKVNGRDNLGVIVAKLKVMTGEVVNVATGYQTFKKDKVTGSFVHIDSSLINRRISTNILSRLEDVTSGALFNLTTNRQFKQSEVEIRGRSTLFANTSPLIILDNFPYDGSINNINPQDVESITVLKDAAAAAVWGVRAGNGVIVITTRKGRKNMKPKISFSSNVTAIEKPDLFYQPQLSSTQFIEVEDFLFANGKYNSLINTKYSALSPAVEIMLSQRNGAITMAERNRRLDSLSAYDIRNDIDKYFNRTGLNQQYQVNISGGGEFNRYYFSAGYDNNAENAVGAQYKRITINANNSYSLFGNRVDLETGMFYSLTTDNSSEVSFTALYPYMQLADKAGNPLPVVDGRLRLPYVDTAGNGRLLDWHYYPLDELNKKYNNFSNDVSNLRLKANLSIKIINPIKLDIMYTHERQTGNTSSNWDAQSFNVRDLINQFSQINQSTGEVVRPVPLGGILSQSISNSRSHYGRIQATYVGHIDDRQTINGAAGVEIKSLQTLSNGSMLYGYDKETKSNANQMINHNQDYKYYFSNTTARINPGDNALELNDRYLSYYANVVYSFSSKYLVSASVRRDESNIFGVTTNQKGVPLWSVGLAYELSRESFYQFELLPYLKARLTYGYNGNVDNSVSAYFTTETNPTRNPWTGYSTRILNPPNPSLRWEKVKNINAGVDFGFKNNIITGAIDYWVKEGLDLIGNSPLAPQTGIILFRGNSANTRTHGVDAILNAKILDRSIKWNSVLLFNYSKGKVVDYKVSNGSNYNVVNGNYNNPLEGYPYYSMFSFGWAGLDTLGNPLSILGGKASNDYPGVINSKDRNDLVFNGSTVPTIFGSLRNTVAWKGLELSFNISYRFDYYFRRKSLNNTALYNGSGESSYRQPDYDIRWKQKGDELVTNVPALIYPANTNRTNIYTYSDFLAERADNIRLQDIRLLLELDKILFKSVRKNLNLILYANNIGIIWKQTKYKIDPDISNGTPNPRNYSVGINVTL